jgi:hypothetical protein
MSTLRIKPSTWIAGMRYLPVAPEFVSADEKRSGFLETRTKDGHTYYHLVPSWLPGLLVAARSAGWAFNKLVRGKRESVKVEA